MRSFEFDWELRGGQQMTAALAIPLSPLPLEVMQFSRFDFPGVYEQNHSPSGRVGLSGPERVFAAAGIMRLHHRERPSPAATASDPPEGRVMQLSIKQPLKSHTTSPALPAARL